MNTSLFISLTLLAALFFFPAAAEDANSTPPPLKCDVGPVNKTYGETQWFVYSCNDDQTLVIVSAPGNPATPFYFKFSPREDGYHLSGEGSGLKDAATAAVKDLKALSKQDIANLIEATKQKP